MPGRLLLAGVVAVAFAAQPLVSQDNVSQDGATSQQPAQNGIAQGEQHPRAHRPLPKPTNLQVLPKDTDPEQLIKIMRGFAGSLGVECNFCHAANPQTHKLDFASDAKEDKGFARTMMEMTRTINEQYMTKIDDPDAKPEDKRVTCGTCHRGHSMPEQFVPPPEHHGPPGAGAPGGMPMGTPPPNPPQNPQ